jgi:hypothetical protein
MIDLLLLLLFNSLYCLGFYLAIQDGMILNIIKRKLERLGYYYMPIGGCITCMASLHGWPYLLYNKIGLVFIIYIFALASLNTIIYNKYLNDD